jgi:hypothetical protein
VFAAALQAELIARRLQRDKAASSGRFAWMEKVTTAAADAVADAIADATADAAAVGDESAAVEADTAFTQHPTDLAAAVAAAVPVTASKLQKGLKGISVNVVELEETFAGPVRLAAADTYRPLAGSVKLSSHLLGAAANAAAAAAAGGGVGNAAAHVKSGRPLHEVIAAANAQLASRYRRQVASGLRELCEKLQAGAAGNRPAAAPAAAAAGAGAAAAGAGAAAAAVGRQGSRIGASKEQAGLDRPGVNSDGEEKEEQDDGGDNEGDVYATLSLLRRLQLWPVTAELLKSTAAGKQVSSLAKNHPSLMVRDLARQVVAQWKAILAMQAAAAAAAKAAAEKEAADAKAATKGGGSNGSKKAAAGPLIEAELRSRVAVMIRDALVEHRGKVLQQQQQQQQQGGGAAAAAAAAAKSNVPADEIPRLQELANKLEDELHMHILSSSSSSSSNDRSAAAAAAGRASGAGGSSSAVTDYKKQARMLCTGLRYPDGIAGQLLTGERAPKDVSTWVTCYVTCYMFITPCMLCTGLVSC